MNLRISSLFPLAGALSLGLSLSAAAPADSPQPVAPQPVARTAPAPATEASPSEAISRRVDSTLAFFNVQETGKAARLRAILIDHYTALAGWHQTNDEQIKLLWQNFSRLNAAPTQSTNLVAAAEQIDQAYASFKPSHEAFLAKLAAEVSAEQIEAYEEDLTLKRLGSAFRTYEEAFPALTDSQKAFLLDQFKAAREQAIDAGSVTERLNFFKKQSVPIELYLRAQGYDVRKGLTDYTRKRDQAKKLRQQEEETKQLRELRARIAARKAREAATNNAAGTAVGTNAAAR